ncbi:MAG: serine hydrolase, partial [Verrucomicrobiota bacterium]
LHSEGVSPSAPVSSVWPELLAGKSGQLSFSGLLAHRSGLAAMDEDNCPSILNHTAVVSAMERQQPFWTAGEGHGYHPRTIGALADEVVRRVLLGFLWGNIGERKSQGPMVSMSGLAS